MGTDLSALPKAFIGVVALILFSSGSLFSQQAINIDAPKIFSPSPQSTSLHAVVRLPQVGNAGAPDISILLYTIRSGGIEVPIVLRYSTYNCKIDGSTSPNVGFGWVLDFGGSISRTVKNKPDEMYRMFQISKNSNQWPVFDQLSSEDDQETLSGLYAESSSGSYDTEYDSFSFVHPGGSGSFYLKRTDPVDMSSRFKAYFSPDYNYRLSNYGGSAGNFISSMEISDSKGLRYKYGGGLTPNDTTVEFAYSSSLNYDYPSAWLLSTIKNDAGDSIKYFYSRLGYTQAQDNSQYELIDQVGIYNQYFTYGQSYLDNFSAVANNATMALNMVVYRSLMPKKIQFAEGEVSFELDPATNTINKVVIMDRFGNLIRDITFVTSPNNLSTLSKLLSSVVIKDAALNTVQTDTLKYNKVTFSGNLSYDYWGYFNGTVTSGSGHLPNRTFSLACYPNYAQDIPLGNNGHLLPDTTYIKHNILRSITYPSGGETEYDFESNTYSMEREQTLPSTYIGPGLRLRSTINKDKDNTILEKRTYEYVTGVIPVVPNTEDANTTYTTYTVYAGPDEELFFPDVGFIATNRNRLVSPKYTAYMGLAGETISYETVTEYYYDGSTVKGSSASSYFIPNSVTYSPNYANESEVPTSLFPNWYVRHLTTDNLWESAYIISRSVYDQSGNPVKSTSYSYANANKDTLAGMGFYKLFYYSIYSGSPYEPYKLPDYLIIDHIKTVGLMDSGNFPPLPPLMYYFYLTYKGVSYPSGEIVTYYYPGGTSYQEARSYQYTPLTGEYHFPRKYVENSSLGDQIVTEYKYPFDSLTVMKYRSMVYVHNLSSLVLSANKYRQNGSTVTPLENYVQSYDSLPISNNPACFRPKNGYYASNGESPEKRIEYLNFNPKGRVLDFKQDYSKYTTYLWTYNNSYPMSRTDGVNYSTVYSTIGASTIADYANNYKTEAEYTDLFGSLRSNIDGLTQGRIYQLLYGTTLEQSPSGNTLRYYYDDFQRLFQVTDNTYMIKGMYEYRDDSTSVGSSYIRTFAPDSAVTSIGQIGTANQRIGTTYFDGIYRQIQTVGRSASPTGKDAVAMTHYNWNGSPDKQYLPYTITSDGSFRTSATTEQPSFYNQIYSGEGSYANTRTEYDLSPLQRVVREYTQGSDYSSDSRAVTYVYSVNTTSEVRKWTMNGSALVNSGYYTAGTLQKTTVTDADSRVSMAYKDKQGKEIESRQENSNQLITSYVYDNNERLACVIPPKAQQDVAADPGNTALCFKYIYDSRDRMEEQYIPDKGTIYNVYDADNRLVYTQDANLRPQNKWQFFRYDKYGREAYSGLVSYAGSFSTLTGYYAAISYNETKTGSGPVAGYTNTGQSLDVALNDVLKVTWYDTYTQADKIAFSAMGAEVGQPAGYTTLTTPYALVTGTKVKVLDGNEHTSSAIWLTSTMYYNALEELVQAVRETYTGSDKGQERASMGYRNQGEVYAVKTAGTANGVTTTFLDQRGYDPRGRLVREWHTINGGTPVLVSSITYDEIERMSSNALGNSIVSMAYTYDIQNRLRKINDPANLGTKPFAMELQYNSPDVSGATAQFAGNISAARWKHLSGSEQTYYYSYDSYSRLTGGIHGGGNNEQSIGYDSNGNINALTRTGAQAAGLSYTYSGNRLTSLTKDGTPYSYAYDSNGNTTTDGLRGMTISYNYLNLPNTVTKGSDVLTYIYDAAGGKLAEKLNSTVNNFYTGAIVYKGDKTIDYIQTSTGIVRKVGADFVRQYNINDHLGNVRAVVNQSGTIEQSNDYYPYGLAFSYNNLDKNRYLYNGKEIQNQTLAATFFGVYDYGARYYDPVIGRFNTIDRFAEKYLDFSPYNYAANNPIKYIDVNGDSLIVDNSILQNKQLTSGFEQFMGTKQGLAFLSRFAASGQKIMGHTFDKDGDYSKQGMDLTYSAKDLGDGDGFGVIKGETGDDIKENGRLGIGITMNTNAEATTKDSDGNPLTSFNSRVFESTKTFFHESFIHGSMGAKDFLNNGKMDYSNISQAAKSATGMPNHYQHTQSVMDYAKSGYNSRNLWPASAYWGLYRVNQNLKTGYTPQKIVDIMWNFEGSR